MQKSIQPFIVVALILSVLLSPIQTGYAQGISLPAEINKTFTPISIAAGANSLLRVTIFNPNSFQLTSASWTDNLPTGITIVGVSANTCGGTVTAAPGSTTISLSGGTVPAQTGSTPGSCTVSVNVTSTVPGAKINTIPVGALRSTGGGTNISNTSPASATLNVTATGTPSVSKSFSPNAIWAGGTSQLTINITNGANTTLTQASLVDNLPANVFLANPVNPNLSGCGGSASLTATSGGTSVTLNNGSIPAGTTCTITVNVTSNVQGSYNNRIPANALQTQQGLTNSTAATARLTVREIGLTKGFSPGTVSGGGTTTLTITLQNPKSTPYTGVNVTDNLPAPLIVSGATSTCVPPGTVSTTANSVTLTGGTIPAGSITSPGTCRIVVTVTVPAGTPSGALTNSIPAGALTTTQGVGNLTAANANVTVSGTDVTGVKSFSPTSIPVGGNARLRIDIFAPSGTNLTNFSVTDPLPAGITVSNSTPPAVTGCGAAATLNAPTGATSISLTGGLILAGQRCRIDVYVTSSTPSPVNTPYTNTIPPTSITNNENLVPSAALTANLTVTGNAALSIALVKGFEPPQVFGGSASTMSIDLINPEAVALTNIAFTDNMPNGMILANPVNFNVGTCGGTLSGVPGANSFSFSGGSLPPFGTCTLTLSATMTVNGNLTNQIPAGAVTTDNGVTNADPVAASLTNLPGASVSKAFAPNPIAAGSYSALTITVQNTGNIGLTGMGVSDSLPAGLAIADAPAPAPVNNCGGTLTAVAGTQLIELVNGVLAGNASCTMVVSITGASAGDFQNTIPAGALKTDPTVNVTNTLPATDTLTITGSSGGGGTPPGGGGGNGGGGGGGGSNNNGNNNNKKKSSTGINSFSIPVTGFAPGRVTKVDASSHPTYAATSLTIAIPVLKVNTSIVGVESKKGTWDVSWLQNQIGWLNGTAYPTWSGNSVLTGHVVNADGKPGVFAKLKSLGIGEYVFVYDSGYRYIYKVVSNTLVQPNDASVMNHKDKSFLTLITCDGYDAKTGTYLQRVVIGASLVDAQPMK
jgi:LPXTG-site transpeptidase (sortase) family protein